MKRSLLSKIEWFLQIALLCVAIFFPICGYADDPFLYCRLRGKSVLPLEFFHGHYITTAVVNGKSLRMLIDTGAEHSSLSPRVIKEMRLPVNSHHFITVTGIEGRSNATHPAIVQSIKLGDCEWLAHELHPAMVGRPEDDPASPVGIIGPDLLSAYDVEFDFPQKTMTLYDQLLCPEKFEPWEGELQSFKPTRLKGNLMIIQVSLNGNAMHVSIDTGANESGVARKAALSAGVKEAAINRSPQGTTVGAIGNGVKSHLYHFKWMTIGGSQFEEIPLTILDSALSPGIDMLLGTDYLHRGKLWISYSRNQVFMQGMDTIKPGKRHVVTETPAAPPSASAAGVKIEGLPIRIGDTVEDMQKAFATKLEPQPVQTSQQDIAPVTQLRFATKGIWAFFQNGKIVILRVESPFSGNIGGIRIGDPSSKIEKTLGPAIHGSLRTSSTYSYNFHDLPTTRFDINRDNDQIEKIFFQKNKTLNHLNQEDQRIEGGPSPVQGKEGRTGAPISQVQIPSRFVTVDITKENFESELNKCVPEGDLDSRDVISRLQKFPSNMITRFGGTSSATMFVLHKTTAVCLQKSSENFTIFAAEEFFKTVNPEGVSPDVLDAWYKKIAVLIATKGMAKIAYVFNNGNAFIATYWVESDQDFALSYSFAFKKAGEWETEKIDAKFSDPTMTSVSETKRSGLSQKKFPLDHLSK